MNVIIIEQPKMKEALRKFSDKQSQRTYSARSYKTNNNTSTSKQFEKRDEAVERYRQFLHRNQKYFSKDSTSKISSNDETSSEWEFPKDRTPSISTKFSSDNKQASNNEKNHEPKPPEGDKPSSGTLKHRFSRRMSR